MERLERARAHGNALLGEERYTRLVAELTSFDPEFAELMQGWTFGGFYSREVLDQKTRELCAVSALTALNAQTQMLSHARNALNAGANRAEVMEAILQTAVYCGLPYVIEAARALTKALPDWRSEGLPG